MADQIVNVRRVGKYSTGCNGTGLHSWHVWEFWGKL